MLAVRAAANGDLLSVAELRPCWADAGRRGWHFELGQHAAHKNAKPSDECAQALEQVLGEFGPDGTQHARLQSLMSQFHLDAALSLGADLPAHQARSTRLLMLPNRFDARSGQCHFDDFGDRS